MNPVDTVDTVLFADDGSAGSDVAWLWMVNHAWAPWQVQVLHVDQPATGQVLPPGSGGVRAWQPETPRRLPSGAGWAVPEHLRAAGDPRVVLIEQDWASLLVVGARGRGLMKSMHVGSTVEWLLSAPPVPLAIVRSGRQTSRVMVCIDGSPDADAAAGIAAALPWIGGVEVMVVAVHDHPVAPRAAVDRAVASFRAAGAVATARIVEADELPVFYSVRDVLLQIAHSESVDLVVLGTRGLSGMASRRHGSVASGLARHATCSVLIAQE